MPNYTNFVAIATPRNGTTTHTVDPSTGTTAGGTLFTPTSGRLLVCFAMGGVTSTTPSGWTLPAGGSAINNMGVYVWHRTAAGSDTFTTTHNASNYAVLFVFLEYASGSTFGGSTAGTAIGSGSAGPNRTGLTGTNQNMAVCSSTNNTAGTISFVWNIGTELVDTSIVNGATEGYGNGLTLHEDSTATSFNPTVTTTPSSLFTERLSVSLVAAGGAAAVSGLRVRRPHQLTYR